MATPKKQKTQHSLVEITPHIPGDMVIEVGKDGDVGKIKVHKTVMMMASPVIKAMIGGGFQEASAKLDESDPLVLKQDDRETFTVMCQFLHHQPVVGFTSGPKIAKLVVMADFYGCSDTIVPHLIPPLKRCMKIAIDSKAKHGSEERGMLGNLMCLAYKVKDGDLLREASRCAIIHFTSDDECNASLSMLFPDKMLEGLKAIRVQETKSLYRDLMNSIAKALKPKPSAHSQSPMGYCRGGRELIGGCMITLDFLEEGTMRTAAFSTSLKSICGEIVAKANMLKAETRRAPMQRESRPCACANCRGGSGGGSAVDLVAVFNTVIQGRLKKVRGLCLECYERTSTFVEDDCTHSESE